MDETEAMQELEGFEKLFREISNADQGERLVFLAFQEVVQ
jgi:hypothetical protein